LAAETPRQVSDEQESVTLWIEYIEKELRVKSLGAWTLDMLLAGIRESEGPWYVIECRLLDRHDNVVLAVLIECNLLISSTIPRIQQSNELNPRPMNACAAEKVLRQKSSSASLSANSVYP
jgi:hypothetical protein